MWAWSEGLVYEVQVAVTRAADALAGLALAHDDPDTAEWATRQGLLAMPRLSLFDSEVRVAAYRRDLDGLNSAFHAGRRAEQALDPLVGDDPGRLKLLQKLTAQIRASL